MLAKLTGSLSLTILVCVLSIQFGCHDTDDLTFVPTQLDFVDDQLVVVGTSYSTSSIRHPTICKVGKSPNVYRSETSARGVTLKTIDDDKLYLSYFQAKSLERQEEESHLFTIENNKLGSISTFGNRTRIIDFLPIATDTFIYLNYERSTASSSLKWYSHNSLLKEKNIVVGTETTIPKQLLQLPDSNLLILGIADGFEFKDGHSYIEKYAKGFVIKTDAKGADQNQWIKSEDNGHVFFKQAIMANNFIYIVGEIQQEENGMDVFILKLTEEFKLVGEFVLEKLKHQHILDIYTNGNSIDLIIKDKNRVGQNLVTLLHFDLELTLKNNTKLVGIDNTDFIDVIKEKNNYYVLAHQKDDPIAIPKSVLLNINEEGEMIKEIKMLTY
jgi:hypothetical protein